MTTSKFVYIICPVAKCSPGLKTVLDQYAAMLRRKGYTVHYPLDPACCDQNLDGREICDIHRKAMARADEVHIWWDETSRGSVCDFGMAMIMSLFKPVKFVLINERSIKRKPGKCYENVLLDLVHETNIKGGEKFHFEGGK